MIYKKNNRYALSILLYLTLVSGCATPILNLQFALEDRVTTLIELSCVSLFTGLTLFTYLYREKGRIPINGIDLSLVVFVLAIIHSQLIAQVSGVREDFEKSWELLAIALLPVISHLGARAFVAYGASFNVVSISAVTITVICSLSIILEWLSFTSIEAYGTRYFGFMGDPGPWLLVFGISTLLIGNRFPLCWGIGFCALLLTQSIGATLVLIGVLGLFFLFVDDTGNRAIKVGILAIIGFASVGMFEYTDYFHARLINAQPVFDDRLKTNLYTLQVAANEPFFGGGYGSHAYQYNKESVFLETRNFVTWSTPTSTYLQIFADFGLLGIVPWSMFVFLVLRAALRIISLPDNGSGKRLYLGAVLWTVSFLLVNHTAAWLIPGSALSILVFICTGLISGLSVRRTSSFAEQGRT